MQNINTRSCRLLLTIGLCLLLCGCADRPAPPFFQATVTTVYQETFEVHNLRLRYWWEERGETPFLKPHEYYAREFIAEIVTPVAPGSPRVDVTYRRIPFASIKSIRLVLRRSGKDVIITPRNGARITTTTRFPQLLRTSDKMGLADYGIQVSGIRTDSGTPQEWTANLDAITEITFTGISDRLP